MARRNRFNSLRLSAVACTAFSVLAGFGVLLLIIFLFAFLITKIDVSNGIISVMTSIALCAGAYTGGLISARKRRKNGLLMGVICGFFMFLVIFLLSTFFAQTTASFSGSAKLIMTLIFGAIGGVVGVNSKSGRF